MVWSGSIFEPSRLMAIDSLGKITVQERILDIELVNRPLTGRCKVKYCTYGCWFHHRRESLMEIYSRSLREPSDNPSGFAPLERSVGVELVLEQPLPGDDIGMCWPRHQRPSAVGLQSIILRLHRC